MSYLDGITNLVNMETISNISNIVNMENITDLINTNIVNTDNFNYIYDKYDNTCNYFKFKKIQYKYSNNNFINDLSFNDNISNINLFYKCYDFDVEINKITLFSSEKNKNNITIRHFIGNNETRKQFVKNKDINTIYYNKIVDNNYNISHDCHKFYSKMKKYLKTNNIDINYKLINNCKPKLITDSLYVEYSNNIILTK